MGLLILLGGICVLLFWGFLALRWLILHRRARRTLADIDKMSGEDFEVFVQALLSSAGWHHVEHTGKTGDFGADVVAERGGIKWAIQVKRYSAHVGVGAVQEAIAAKAVYGCQRAAVVTNSTFTRSAKALARANDCLLLDRRNLIHMLNGLRG